MEDKIFWENLIKVLKRGSWTMNGEELLVFYELMRICHVKQKESLAPKMDIKPITPPVKELKKSKK